MMFTMLKPWEERSGEENSSLALVGKAMGFFTSIKEAMVFALNPPAIAELGIAGGFTFKLEDVGGNGAERSEEHTSELQSLMRISYAVFCLKKKKRQTNIKRDIQKERKKNRTNQKK